MLMIFFKDFDHFEVLDRDRYILGVHNARPVWAPGEVWNYVEVDLLNGIFNFPEDVNVPGIPRVVSLSLEFSSGGIEDAECGTGR